MILINTTSNVFLLLGLTDSANLRIEGHVDRIILEKNYPNNI